MKDNQMRFLQACIVLTAFVVSPAFGASFFHSFVTDLNPPYICKLKLKDASGVSIDTKHTYKFTGICSIKIPVGNSYIYQNVWVETNATWDSKSNDASEQTTLANNLGTVNVTFKCDDDPWLTKGQCAILGYQNNTQFTNLSGVYNARNGQYPPFETSTGQYPPLARNQAILREAIVLSVIHARQEANQAQAAFNQTFGQSIEPAPAPVAPPAPVTTKIVKKVAPRCITRIFYKPRMSGLRLDVCLKLNRDCGKPAADRFCQAMGYRRALSCKLDNTPSTPTFIIGTQAICRQSFCKGFEMIECVK